MLKKVICPQNYRQAASNAALCRQKEVYRYILAALTDRGGNSFSPQGTLLSAEAWKFRTRHFVTSRMHLSLNCSSPRRLKDFAASCVTYCPCRLPRNEVTDQRALLMEIFHPRRWVPLSKFPRQQLSSARDPRKIFLGRLPMYIFFSFFFLPGSKEKLTIFMTEVSNFSFDYSGKFENISGPLHAFIK